MVDSSILIFWGEGAVIFRLIACVTKHKLLKGQAFSTRLILQRNKLPLQLLNIIVAEVILKQKMIDAQFCLAPATGNEL